MMPLGAAMRISWYKGANLASRSDRGAHFQVLGMSIGDKRATMSLVMLFARNCEKISWRLLAERQGSGAKR
eukprot:12256318-Alexandrium_andersonii.AAC.1